MSSQKQPRVSSNKMAEFVYATPARRETIVRQQKTNKPFIAGSYRDAGNFIPHYFSQQQDLIALEKKIQNLTGLYSMTPTPTINNSINGLTALRQIAPLNLGDVSYYSLPHNSSDGLIIEDVFINVRPDALLIQRSKGIMRVGAVKLHFPRTNPLGDNGGECVAAVLCEYLGLTDQTFGLHKHSLCYAVDVFPGTIYQAPASYKRIMKDVEAACRQYKMIWDSI